MTTEFWPIEPDLWGFGGGGSGLHADLTDLATSGHPIEVIDFGNNLKAEIAARYAAGLLARDFTWTGGVITQSRYRDTDGGTIRYTLTYSYTGSRIDSWTITRHSDSQVQTFTVTYSGNKVDKVVVS